MANIVIFEENKLFEEKNIPDFLGPITFYMAHLQPKLSYLKLGKKKT